MFGSIVSEFFLGTQFLQIQSELRYFDKNFEEMRTELRYFDQNRSEFRHYDRNSDWILVRIPNFWPILVRISSVTTKIEPVCDRFSWSKAYLWPILSVGKSVKSIFWSVFWSKFRSEFCWLTVSRSKSSVRSCNGSVKITFRPTFFWPTVFDQNVGQNHQIWS